MKNLDFDFYTRIENAISEADHVNLFDEFEKLTASFFIINPHRRMDDIFVCADGQRGDLKKNIAKYSAKKKISQHIMENPERYNIDILFKIYKIFEKTKIPEFYRRYTGAEPWLIGNLCYYRHNTAENTLVNTEPWHRDARDFAGARLATAWIADRPTGETTRSLFFYELQSEEDRDKIRNKYRAQKFDAELQSEEDQDKMRDKYRTQKFDASHEVLLKEFPSGIIKKEVTNTLDCLFFGGDAIHKTQDNISPTPRNAFEFRMSSPEFWITEDENPYVMTFYKVVKNTIQFKIII